MTYEQVILRYLIKYLYNHFVETKLGFFGSIPFQLTFSLGGLPVLCWYLKSAHVGG